jgi:hypothetical protein
MPKWHSCPKRISNLELCEKGAQLKREWLLIREMQTDTIQYNSETPYFQGFQRLTIRE